MRLFVIGLAEIRCRKAMGDYLLNSMKILQKCVTCTE